MESKQQTCSFFTWEVGAWREAPLQPSLWLLSPDLLCQGADAASPASPPVPTMHARHCQGLGMWQDRTRYCFR